jgi:hypothetical protein
MFGYGGQDKIKYKKSILPLTCIIVKLTYFLKNNLYWVLKLIILQLI